MSAVLGMIMETDACSATKAFKGVRKHTKPIKTTPRRILLLIEPRDVRFVA
jgi:hypothetical protein